MSTGFDVRVLKRSEETADIVSLELENIDKTALFPFTAGAHIDFTAPNGMLRQYSLCGNPSDCQSYLVGILRDPKSRGASEAIHQQVQEGDIVRISAPKNHFELLPAKHSLLLAAGIGVTPLLSMAEQLIENGDDFELHYYARSRDRAAFLSRFEGQGAKFAGRVTFHFDDEIADHSQGMRALLSSPSPQVHAYICGPSGFIELVCTTAKDNGWQGCQLHVEHFSASQRVDETVNSFNVRIASTDEVHHIPHNESIANVLAKQGIAIPMSCQEGVCGTCITAVLEGEPDHRDCYFSDEEKAQNNQMMPCCSRSKSLELVLDL